MGGPGSGRRPGGGTGRHASLNKTRTPGTRAERMRNFTNFRHGARVPENIKTGKGRKKSVEVIKRMPAITRKLNREANRTMTRSMRNAMRKK